MEDLYYITNDKNYLAIDCHKAIITVANADKAQLFTYTKGNNVLSNLKTSLKNLGYYLKKKEVEEPTETIEWKYNKEVKILEDEIDIDKIMDTISNFEDMAKNLIYTKTSACEAVSKLDREIEDILHACEFYNYDAYKGYKMYKMLQDKRVRRRKLKQYIGITGFIEEILNDNFMKSSLTDRINNKIFNKYRPRELKELFKEEDILD